jgi:hypothetical protein
MGFKARGGVSRPLSQVAPLANRESANGSHIWLNCVVRVISELSLLESAGSIWTNRQKNDKNIEALKFRLLTKAPASQRCSGEFAPDCDTTEQQLHGNSSFAQVDIFLQSPNATHKSAEYLVT